MSLCQAVSPTKVDLEGKHVKIINCQASDAG